MQIHTFIIYSLSVLSLKYINKFYFKVTKKFIIKLKLIKMINNNNNKKTILNYNKSLNSLISVKIS